MFKLGKFVPGARPVISRGIVGVLADAAVPYEHLNLSNLPCIILEAIESGSPCK